MNVTKEDLATVAKLSRLSVGEAEEEAYLKDLNAFITYVENLKAVDTDNVPPTTYAIPMQNIFREDKPRPSLFRDDALKNAPEEENGYFRVPRVLEE